MRTLWPLLLLALGAGLPAVKAGQPAAAEASRALHELFEREWEYDLAAEPVRASWLGDRRWNDRWPDVGLEPMARRHEHNREVLAALHRIDRSELPPDDRISYDLFAREYETRLAEHELRLHLIPLDQRSGIHTSHDLTDTLRFETGQDHLDWIARLQAFPAYVDGTIELMREGIAARVMQPRIIIERVVAQLDSQIVDSADASPYYARFVRMPPALPEAQRADLAQRAARAVEDDVVPALVRLRAFLADEYLPAAFEAAGVWQIPDGLRAYETLARKFTTLDSTAEEIHEIGLKEVDRIRREMDGLMAETGFEGSLAEFFTFLRTDARFYYETGEELLESYRAMAKRVDPLLVRLFRLLPRMPYGVEPIPEITAPHTTTAYYQEPAADGSRAGTYYVNLYRPETRPRYEMMALSLHEAVPGHHLQIALAMELDLPSFRRYAGYTAFVEGWALYAEHLGDELGLYDDPYTKFGQLTYEMWRAVRLVVDTGIHAFRWDRQRAIDYFMAHAPRSQADIVNEIDRYIGWPGQALAYKMGELKIKELRARAEAALGERFDVREFHEVVLGAGAVTLEVLEEQVEAWMEGTGN